MYIDETSDLTTKQDENPIQFEPMERGMESKTYCAVSTRVQVYPCPSVCYLLIRMGGFLGYVYIGV